MNDSRCWAEIDTGALAHNTQVVKNLIGPQTKLCAVVKANAYGHGAVECSRVFIENGAEMLAVATYEEAIQLRDAGLLSAPNLDSSSRPGSGKTHASVLILGFVPKSFLPDAIRQNFHLCCYNMTVLEDISAAAEAVQARARIHIKFDTGLTRLGFAPNANISPILDNKNVEVVGTFSHLASADMENECFSQSQFEMFQESVDLCPTNLFEGRQGDAFEETMRMDADERHRENINGVVRHLTNTAGTARFPKMHMELVRVGLALYGYDGLNGTKTNNRLDLRPAMSLKASVVDVKTVPPGTAVSYNRTYVTRDVEQIAVVSAGYADGYPHRLSNKASIEVGGRLHKQVGYICMDYCMARLQLGNNVKAGDVATLLGGEITAEALAGLTETNIYSILCGVAPRAKRQYL